ncbi:DUF3108 domain-containing protein [Nitratireductor sp. L1-7-SE]|uniref:DUF3108 domain-containing protein n=1 Tax=Nitratireductor rhodophyticola TaxID=2854036 RepID=A0ABS7R4T9_9HYPH|nr:DUF3108 domain-containing protein [Nitratireductor rhodophyticola]MBY8915943.1 DUF3108 domain-containing protein [Nitratireductor rhodophyticola]MBY8921306.1 DUF3108 domain-containing protein [Nitratireductor rhodophyticola]
MAGSARAESETHRFRYSASLFGIPIGKADFTSRLEESRFEVSGRFASAGVARLFDRTDGTVSSKGRLSGRSVVPSSYELAYVSGKKRETTSIRYSRGQVAETVITPKPKKRGKDWIVVSKEDLAGALDPLSALLSPARNAADVCNRRFRVFDGEMRADIVFSPAAKGEHIGRDLVTCKARFIPVSGYRKGRSTIAFLRDRARILVAFKPLGTRGHHTPVQARIGTKIGTVHIEGRPVD